MIEVWNEWIDPNNKPVRATTQASLATKKLLVEIQVTAALKSPYKYTEQLYLGSIHYPIIKIPIKNTDWMYL